MSTILETVWDLEPHTEKKHEILRRYFQAWLPILAQANARLLYIDAFAGPGEYSKGEDGSPLVILKAARDHVLKFSSELICLFVESKDDRYQHLMEVLERIKPTLPDNIKFRAFRGEFNDQLTRILASVEEQRKLRAPTLAFMDPFGFSEPPFSTIAKLMKYPKSEVLVNFMYQEINRFLSAPQFAAHFDAKFGTPEWREATKISDALERLRAIHDLYFKQLGRVAKYVQAFLMVNKSNSPDYLLFFATNSLKGMEAMLQAMWKADPTGEFQFSDFIEARKQLPLFPAAPDYDLLREILTYEFRHTEIEIGVLGDWVVENKFLRTHIRTVLAQLEKEGVVSLVNPKPGRRRYTYPDGTILRFR